MHAPSVEHVLVSPNSAVAQEHSEEVRRGERFEFGENWRQFLAGMNPASRVAAQKSLCDMLDVKTLAGKTFLDIGSGSGLFSLAARDLGATVFSFDYDTSSVECTKELRRRYFTDDPNWKVEQGSVLDAGYLAGLGQFDIVYSWGVLHHTGKMWEAVDNASKLVKPGGRFFIALYNDQGGESKMWTWVKRNYCRRSAPVRWLLLLGSMVYLWTPTFLLGLLRGHPFRAFRQYQADSGRGMKLWRDLIDWVGGYPFEVATPGKVFDFCRARGMRLTRMTTLHSVGCNEFVFVKE